jgi:hypothetical protein
MQSYNGAAYERSIQFCPPTDFFTEMSVLTMQVWMDR